MDSLAAAGHAPQDVELSATVVNDNLLPGLGEVAWVWEGLELARAEATVDAQSQATATATATIEREGRDQVTAEVIRASGGDASVTGMPRRGYPSAVVLEGPRRAVRDLDHEQLRVAGETCQRAPQPVRPLEREGSSTSSRPIRSSRRR